MPAPGSCSFPGPQVQLPQGFLGLPLRVLVSGVGFQRSGGCWGRPPRGFVELRVCLWGPPSGSLGFPPAQPPDSPKPWGKPQHFLGRDLGEEQEPGARKSKSLFGGHRSSTYLLMWGRNLGLMLHRPTRRCTCSVGIPLASCQRRRVDLPTPSLHNTLECEPLLDPHQIPWR